MLFNVHFNNISAISCIAQVFYSPESLCVIRHLGPTVGCQMSTLYCREEMGLQKYFLYAQMSIQCVICAFTETYLLLVAINHFYILLFITFYGFEAYRLIGR